MYQYLSTKIAPRQPQGFTTDNPASCESCNKTPARGVYLVAKVDGHVVLQPVKLEVGWYGRN